MAKTLAARTSVPTNFPVTRGYRHMRRVWALATFFLTLSMACLLPRPAAAQVKEVRRVLILNEVGSSYPGINLIDRGLSTALDSSRYQLEVYREYMETALFPDPADQQQFRASFLAKYRNRKPDVIITVGPSPLRLMAETHETFFPGVPVVFALPNNGAPGSPTLDSHFAGVQDAIQAGGTVDLALRLQPGSRHVVVVGGTAAFDKQVEAVVRQQLRPYEGRLDVSYLTNIDMPGLLEQVKHLPDHTILLFLSFAQDAAGTHFVSATQAAPMVVAAANAPVFSLFDVHMNHGEVGGRVSSLFRDGEIAGRMAVRALNGENTQDISVVTSPTLDMFDWRALRRWGLKETNLPPGSTILNRQPTLWESFRWYVIGGMTLILVEALLISGLLWQRTRRKAAETRLIIANKQLADDIVDRKRTEATLRESEERFRLVANAAPVMIWMSAVDKLCIYFNQGWLEFTGRSLSEELGNGWAEGVHPEDVASCLETYEQAFDRRETFQMQYRLRRHDGEYRWVFDQGVPRFNADGSFAGYIGSCIDITERKWAEESLRQKERELLDAQRLAAVGNWKWDARKDEVTWSEELYRIFGLDPALPAPSYKEHPSLFRAESWERLSRAVDEALRAGTPYELDLEVVRPDGTTRWVRTRGEAVGDTTGCSVGLRGTAQDITERKMADEALAVMSRKLLEAQEQERARIGRELHDDINQRLALLSVEIQRMKEVSPGTYGELRSRIDELGKRTSEISAVVQSLSHELHSSKLEYLGLVSAMKSFCKEFSDKHKVDVAFAGKGIPSGVPPEVSLCLFRVMQEGLHNALKHSGVKLFEVKLLGSPTGIRLTVRDLGKGFDPELAKDTPGLGLISMQERVRLVKGTISITSRPQSGTEINVRVPLSAGVQTEQAKLAGA